MEQLHCLRCFSLVSERVCETMSFDIRHECETLSLEFDFVHVEVISDF